MKPKVLKDKEPRPCLTVVEKQVENQAVKMKRTRHSDDLDEKSISSSRGETGSTKFSCASLKSEASMGQPISFGDPTSKRSSRNKNWSTEFSCASLKSEASMGQPISFGDSTSKRSRRSKPMDEPISFDDPTSERYKYHASSEYGGSSSKHKRYTEEGTEDSRLSKATKNLKEAMEKKYTLATEDNEDKGAVQNRFYSQLLITTAENEGPHDEHTFRSMKFNRKIQSCQHSTVNLIDIFKTLPGQKEPPRTVLMKGVAGIGKSFTVQQFIHEWVKDRTNQDTHFVFCLAFREVNLITENMSLYDLLMKFHPALMGLIKSEDFDKTVIIVILDGLDESRFQLDFKNKTITSITDKTSVSNLFGNLIQGNLLPNAKLWITSRPAATSQIPAEYVDFVTEIRGFSDPQKEEYFKQIFSDDPDLADRIISHIHSSQSLDIMCQIPIFCWIAAVLFKDIFGVQEKAKIPQTLTELMAYFLFTQTKRRNRKFEGEINEGECLLKAHREFFLKLGKLAFVELQKNNLIFYDKNLEAHGIDIKEATIYSGFCNAFFRDESVSPQESVYFFVHLTIQEFFAALFVYDCLTNNNTKELGGFLSLKDKEHNVFDLLKMTVNKVLEKQNGHLDYFLRFLLGLMVETNQRVLRGLLTPPDSSQETHMKILTYIKAIRRKQVSPDFSISLFQTMVEMRDCKVKEEIQEYLKSDDCKTELTALQCSALAYTLLVSKEDLDVLDLKSYKTSEEGRRRLIPVVRTSKKAILANCNVTEEWIEHLAFGLRFPYLPLMDLDLSNNDLKDSGVKVLCEGLSSQHCRLKTLSLSGCLVSEEGCDYLASALKSNPSHLIELDLSYNHPGEKGVALVSELKDNPQYMLNYLNLEQGGIHRMKPGFKKYACELTLDINTAHKNLLVSKENRKVAWEEELQPYSRHIDRFDYYQQILCKEGLEGRNYFEIEGVKPFTVGLTYRSIGRKGDSDDVKLGHNSKSWSLTCSNAGCYAQHDKEISVSSRVSRIIRVGVYLDSVAGTLSFYRVSSDSHVHLHTYRTNLSEPLYPAVELLNHSSALFCQL